MNTEAIERAFEKMGARVKILQQSGRESPMWMRSPFLLDIGRDGAGEYFSIRLREEIPMEVLQVAPQDRHLLLMLTRHAGVKSGRHENREEHSRFLCGHDERHWFVAAIPESDPVSSVGAAKDALRPKDHRVELGHYRRQGEWFFIPSNLMLPRNTVTLHDEPLVRRTRDGRGGKPHIASECYRTGGTAVWVNRTIAPQGFTAEEYAAWKLKNPDKANRHFDQMTRNAQVFVRGEIRHPDHKTLKLGSIWHEVKMNREVEAKAMNSMVFLD
jgi:hypothetical protein